MPPIARSPESKTPLPVKVWWVLSLFVTRTESPTAIARLFGENMYGETMLSGWTTPAREPLGDGVGERVARAVTAGVGELVAARVAVGNAVGNAVGVGRGEGDLVGLGVGLGVEVGAAVVAGARSTAELASGEGVGEGVGDDVVVDAPPQAVSSRQTGRTAASGSLMVAACRVPICEAR